GDGKDVANPHPRQKRSPPRPCSRSASSARNSASTSRNSSRNASKRPLHGSTSLGRLRTRNRPCLGRKEQMFGRQKQNPHGGKATHRSSLYTGLPSIVCRSETASAAKCTEYLRATH